MNKKEKRYTGAITGLGYDKNINKPVYAEYDIETQFDCNYDEKDFTMVRLIFFILTEH